MKMSRLFLGLALAATFGLFAIQTTRGQHEPDGAKLEDKYLKIYLKSDPRTPYALEDVHVRELGGQQFLVGTGADTGVAAKWHGGLVYWVAATDVATMQVHHSRQSLKETYKP